MAESCEQSFAQYVGNLIGEVHKKITGSSWLQGRRLIPLLTQHCSSVSGSVLDLGCGTIPFRHLFPSECRYIRIDRYPVNPDIVVADATSLPIQSGSVEVALLSRVMGDIADVVSVLEELERILAPGGKVLIYESMTYPQHDLPNDYWRVLPGGLRWAADKTGLDVASLDYLGGYFTQLAMQWNIFILGPLDRIAILRPVASLGRACGNLVLAGLDWLLPRPTQASDYFACLVKPIPASSESLR